MSQNWPTKENDLYVARVIMEEYANERNSDSLGLFEVVVDQMKKRMNFRLSGWVVMLSKHFASLYGETKGDFVTRQVISCCMTQGETIH